MSIARVVRMGWPWVALLAGCEARAIGLLTCEPPDDCSDAPACSGSMCDEPSSGDRVKYTFDTGMQEWGLGTYPAPDNLGYLVPDGVPAPTLLFSGTEGDPTPGSLVLSVTFPASVQGAAPWAVEAIVFPPEPLDLSGRTLHARVKLLSGELPGGLQFQVATGAEFAFGRLWVQGTELMLDQWLPVELELDALSRATMDPESPEAEVLFVGPGLVFDPTQVVSIGVSLAASSEIDTPIVLAIDTVID